MFLHWFWSLVLLASPVALYWFVIRPRLQARFTDLYADIDSFWARAWEYTYRFRTFWLGTFGAVMAALPDLLVQIAPLDFSSILPQPWGGWVAGIVFILTVVMKAFETKPKEEQ